MKEPQPTTVFTLNTGSFDVSPLLEVLGADYPDCIAKDIDYAMEKFFYYFSIAGEVPSEKDAAVFYNLKLLNDAISGGCSTTSKQEL